MLIIIYLLSYRGKGVFNYNIQLATYEDWFVYPQEGLENYFTSIWLQTLSLCMSTALLGFLSSLATGIIAFTFAWVGLTTGLLLYFITQSAFIVDAYKLGVEQIATHNTEISSDVIYAEREIIIRKSCIYVRRGGYMQVFFYDQLMTYGEISPNWAFIKWRTSDPSIVELSDVKSFLKHLALALQANQNTAKKEDIRSIAPFLYRERMKILIQGIAFSFGTIVLLILIAWWSNVLPLFF